MAEKCFMCEKPILDGDEQVVKGTIICCLPCNHLIQQLMTMLNLKDQHPEIKEIVDKEDKPPYREIDAFEERARAFAKLLNIFHDDFDCYIDRTSEEVAEDIHSRMLAFLNKARIHMDGFISECN